jgi:UPF0755 protein
MGISLSVKWRSFLKKNPEPPEKKQKIKVRKKRSRVSEYFWKPFRFIFRLISVVMALALGGVALFLGAVIYFNSPPEKTPHPMEEAMRYDGKGSLRLEIKAGETAYSVGRRLEYAGIIRSRYFWYLLFRIDNEYIKTGVYNIELPISLIKLRTTLINGDQLLVKATIPEGVTLKKAAGILEDSGICGAAEFLAAASSREILDACHVPGADMEGYLYPDTYLFPMGYPAPLVVKTMANTFFERIVEIAPEAGRMDSVDLNKRIILASIVEREYRVPEEAAMMAGVFYNRLKIGMALQSCATVEYVITEIQGRPHPEQLFNRDIEIRDPYNTYIRPGLPPGPISAPGETAIRAAFEPTPSNYLYFRLTDPSVGKHYFSRTHDDHIRAGALYVKGR